MASIAFHRNILSSRQLKLLERLGPFMKTHGFYLAGGTAIALILGHRESVDLDWFLERPLGDPNDWADKIRNSGVGFIVRSVTKGTLYLRANGVRVSLLEYRYPMLRPNVEWKAASCSMASLDDLACMKLSAVAQRGSKKDFIDIYALMKKHKSLEQMLKLYQKKFPGHDIAPILYGLSYFDDADNERMPRMIWKTKWTEIKKEIAEALRKARP